MLYHPFEIGIVGYSGSGKTTLLSRLIERMSRRYEIGYYKHDAHKFVMDKPGKDTHIVREAGAEAVYIDDKTHSALIRSGEPSPDLLRAMFMDMEILFVEGRKDSAMPKVFMIDPRGEAEKLFNSPAPPRNLLAVVGAGEAPHYIPPGVPYVQRDDLDQIEALLESQLRARSGQTKLKALILTGGRSSRMGEEKAFMEYRGEPEINRLARLTEELGLETHVSCRPEQLEDRRLKEFTLMPDRFLDFGPMSGLLTALHADPEAAWLVLSCDLPLLDREALEHLIAGRNPFRVATAYLEPENELPEPLVAIWEPKSRGYLHRYLGEGRACPRKLLMNVPLSGVQPKDPEVLRNVNRPEERNAVLEELALAGTSSSEISEPAEPSLRGVGHGAGARGRLR